MATNPGLPLLQLPDVVFHDVYRHFEISELILISQCSKRMKGIIQSQHISTNRPVFRVIIEKCFSKLSMWFPKDRVTFMWFVLPKRPSQLAESKGLIDRRIEGVNWGVKADKEYNKWDEATEKWTSDTRMECFEDDTVAMVRAILNIFNAPISSLEIKFGERTDFDKLLVATDTLHRAKSVVIEECALTTAEMTHMLDTFVAEKLSMRGYAGKAFVYEKPLRFPKIAIFNATWVTPERLMSLVGDTRQVSLSQANLISDEHLNQFLKWWMSSDDRTLETFSIFRGLPQWIPRFGDEPNVNRMDKEKVLEGIPTIPGAKKRRDVAEHFQRYHKYEDGVDIRREDGVLATLMLNGAFEFKVWYDPNPNADGDESDSDSSDSSS